VIGMYHIEWNAQGPLTVRTPCSQMLLASIMGRHSFGTSRACLDGPSDFGWEDPRTTPAIHSFTWCDVVMSRIVHEGVSHGFPTDSSVSIHIMWLSLWTTTRLMMEVNNEGHSIYRYISGDVMEKGIDPCISQTFKPEHVIAV
jgi:hypothetical protein